jgi:hypothetical protein
MYPGLLLFFLSVVAPAGSGAIEKRRERLWGDTDARFCSTLVPLFEISGTTVLQNGGLAQTLLAVQLLDLLC